MPTIADGVAQTEARRAANGGNPVPVNSATPPPNVAPTPPQDLPVGLGLPQRGMFSSNLVLDSDRSDSSRAFRGAGMRSPVFQPQTPSSVTTKITTEPTATVTPTPAPTPTPVVPSSLANQVYATPNGSAGPADLRDLVNADFPTSGVTAGNYTNANITVNAEGIITVAASGSSSSGGGVVGVTTNYNAQNSDAGKLVVFESSYPTATYTLQSTGTATDWFVFVSNAGVGTVIINPNGLMLDGSSSSLDLSENQGVVIFWDGTNYWTERGIGSGSGSGVTTTGSPVSGNLTKFSGTATITNGDLSGDVSTSGTLATTLATVNSNVGSYTNASITVNGKGLITAASSGSGSSTPFFTSTVPYNQDESTEAFATKGFVVTCLQAITINRFYANIYGASGDQYQGAILTMSSSTAISGVAATSASYTFSSNVTGCIMFTFASPVTLTAGSTYAFVIEIITSAGSPASGTSICAMDTSSSLYSLCPGVTTTNTFTRIAAVAPTSGTLLTGATGVYNIAIVGSF